MAKTIIGYFEQVSEAQRVLQDLLDHGFDRDQISLIAHQERSGLEAGRCTGRHMSYLSLALAPCTRPGPWPPASQARPATPRGAACWRS